ncbi:MAG: KGK domain-containing protein [Pseudanabaenaceae cyanobacterium bins.39]|nr:KGK domain-containing protein [Pseudanabaenaceae cyanobacterium bins.39]
MQGKNILLSDLDDEDLFAIGDKFYKVIKLKQAFKLMCESLRCNLGNISYKKYESSRLDLLVFNKNYGRGVFCLPEEFMQDGFSYKFIKLGYPGWQSGLIKLSLTGYLTMAETNEKAMIPHYDFSNVNFGDEDILSFKEDSFCTGKTFKDIFQNSFEDSEFYKECSSIVAGFIPEMNTNQEFFNYGLNLRFLPIKTAIWQPANLRIKFAFETQTSLDIETQNVANTSLLDEIRNSNI